MTTIFRTLVLDLPPTPLGLLPRRWAVQHFCTVCHCNVATGELIGHAQSHTAQTIDRPPQKRVP